MKSFSQFLNEAYTKEMKSVFTKEQLSKIGKVLNEKYNVSVQNSDFKHYIPKTFKLKFGAENGLAICKLIDGTFIILEIANQKSYRVSYIEDNTRYFMTPKDALNQATDIFVFEFLSNTSNMKIKRKENPLKAQIYRNKNSKYRNFIIK